MEEITLKQSIKEDIVSAPKLYTEDALFAETGGAGAENYSAPEHRGLGTPATRASIIEKLIKSGYVIRKGKQLMPTDRAIALIAILPDTLKSPQLTSEWERRLQLIERGESSDSEFMDGITELVKTIVKENNVPKLEFVGVFGNGKTVNEPLGACPRCGSPVREGAKGFFCDMQSCGFKLWKDSRFWSAKKKPLTTDIVIALLKDGCVALKGLYSEKTGKKYDATINLNDTGKYVNYGIVFDAK